MSLRPLMRPLYGSGKTLPQLILPDDVLSDDLENAAEGRVALPSDDHPSNDECPSEAKTCQLSAATAANLCLRPCPCTHGCLGDLNDADLEDITKMREKFKGKDGNNVFFNMVKAVLTATLGKVACDLRKWAIFGKRICRSAFINICGVSNRTLCKMEKAILQGHLQPVDDERKHNGKNERMISKELDVDAFFCFVYQSMAETLADADRACQELVHKGNGAYILE